MLAQVRSFRKTERQRDGETERQRDREGERERHRERERERERKRESLGYARSGAPLPPPSEEAST